MGKSPYQVFALLLHASRSLEKLINLRFPFPFHYLHRNQELLFSRLVHKFFHHKILRVLYGSNKYGCHSLLPKRTNQQLQSLPELTDFDKELPLKF